MNPMRIFDHPARKRAKRLLLWILSPMLILAIFQNCGSGFGVLGSASLLSSLSATGGPGEAPIRRLSNKEYKNSLSDSMTYQFGRQNPSTAQSNGSAVLDSENMRGKLSVIPEDNQVKRLATDQLAAYMSTTRFSAYVEVAGAAADLLTRDLPTLQSFAGACVNTNTDISNVACVDTFIKNFGALAFRKPVSASELAELKSGVSTWRDIIGRIYAHPRFMMHFEREGKVVIDNGTYQLTAYELEAKLCYVFWKSVPDVQGLAAAESGSILTSSGLKTEVARILASPKARTTMWDFYRQWFAVDRIPGAFATYDQASVAFAAPIIMTYPGLGNAALEDGQEFLEYVTWTSKGKLSDVFRSPMIFTTDPLLASAYGVSARTSKTALPVIDSSGHYKGILTRPLITMQKPSISSETNHILRGVFIATNMMGNELGSPANFAEQNQAANAVPEGVSTRTEVGIKTALNTCSGCHAGINPAGYALAHYDTLGRYAMVEKRFRNSDTGAVAVATNPIDSRTSLKIDGVDYAILDADTLVDALFTSGAIYQGFSQYFFRFAFGRTEVAADDKQMLDTLKSSLKTMPIVDALSAMALHPDFARTKATK